MVGIAAFAIIFLSSTDVFGGNDTIPSTPQTAQEWYERGKEAFNNDNYEEAINCFEKGIELDPDYVEAYYDLGDIYAYWYERYEEAVKCFKKVIELEPDYAGAYYNLGRVYAYWDEQYDEAMEYFKKVVELEPDCAGAYYYLGVAYQALSKEKEAIECYKVAAKLENFYARQWLRDNNISW